MNTILMNRSRIFIFSIFDWRDAKLPGISTIVLPVAVSHYLIKEKYEMSPWVPYMDDIITYQK